MMTIRSFLQRRCVPTAAWLTSACLLLAPIELSAQSDTVGDTTQGDALVAEYFQLETAALSTDVVTPGMTRDELEKQQAIDRSRLADMLGLDPMPERTPLNVTTVDSETRDGFRLERLHFQPSPGLYVAANLYLPLEVDEPLPTILYVCGHSRQIKDGVSFGNKAGYHHHGVWFARNGYVCLIIDTIQWGEFLGDHHGTYRLGRWWWNNRGYTPAGVEAWTGMRALDYLETRKEVDADRFGITGRSGGGVYSWWTTALDQRIKVAVPVAGITTLHDHVVNGCVEGHCDCMFMVNTYRWDYPRVAALVAPRPLLISNSDKDGIFPLEGVVETHRQVRDVYRLYGAPDKLGLQITEGPHKDTQELRVHAFRWFNRFLKNEDALITMPAAKSLDSSELRVFNPLPADERVTTADEWFVSKASQTSQSPKKRMQLLQEKTFAGWPSDSDRVSAKPAKIVTRSRDTVKCEMYEFTSQIPYRFQMFVLTDASNSQPIENVVIEALDQERFEQVGKGIGFLFQKEGGERQGKAEFDSLKAHLSKSPHSVFVFFAPRGIGATEWSRNERTRTHIRRRFMLLGQTADSMRIWDVRQAIAAVRQIPNLADGDLRLVGHRNAAAWAVYASLFDEPVNELELIDLAPTNREGLSLLNVSRIAEIDDVVKMAGERAKLIKN
ncbi:alpha/beta hydrolase family protein [Planctomycetes bacterium K23_9]|uniref:Alpha/beta hydrolase family protein n=1 Tax=Stieleria marina TaxID=1930275 RepID=A0A517NX75_9BACT|nr:Alpha/beta hydrolase family protein [Planctomycetes bacterium K23_9]